MKRPRMVLLVVLSVSLLVLDGAFLARGGDSEAGQVTGGHAAGAWKKSCGDWDELQCGRYIVSDNVWNKGSVEDYKQCIFTKEARGCVYKWTWDWPDVGDGQVKAYPEVIFGQKPWMESSTTSKLPVKVTEAGKLRASFEITHSAEGVLNTAFDMWLVADPVPTSENITREVMVWIRRDGLTPGGSRAATVKIGGEKYDLYMADWEVPYYAFVKQVPIIEGEVPLGRLLNYLVANGYVSSEEYVACVELGNEISYGQGSTILRSYAVRVK